jgi:UDP-N-acetylmuramoyl-tripeptide--D-alanyl-D-alanine ligase
MRGEIINFAAGFTIVDDSYNSNPRSLLSMVNTISESGRSASRRLVIAGEMLELGPESARLHREAGSEIAGMDIDILWGVRGFGMNIVEGAREAGMPAEMTRFFENSNQAAEALSSEVREGDLVLVKGSRGVSTDKVVALLKERFAELEDNRTQ